MKSDSLQGQQRVEQSKLRTHLPLIFILFDTTSAASRPPQGAIVDILLLVGLLENRLQSIRWVEL